MYLTHTPSWLRSTLASHLVWDLPVTEPTVYLTFDDGPHPDITLFVLEQLKKYNAKATFFCIGNNVAKYPYVFRQIIEEGHTVGNHTYNHKNGWKTPLNAYLEEIAQADELIGNKIFRPPYGRITRKQANALKELGYTIYMWSVLSADFDMEIDGGKCTENVLKHTKKGAIITFHDSEKAWERLQVALPVCLEQFAREGYAMHSLM